MKFQHNYNTDKHDRVVEQHDSDRTVVDRASYTSMEKRIESMKSAGERLEIARRNQYHFGQGEPLDDDYSDLSLDPTIDISDLDDSIDLNMDTLAQSHENRKEAAKAAAAEKRSKKIAEAKEIAEQAKKELEAESQDTPPAAE